MGAQDKLDNLADEKVGEAKEAVGKAQGDEDLEDEGRVDQTKADLKQAAEKVKDAFQLSRPPEHATAPVTRRCRRCCPAESAARITAIDIL